MTESTKFFNDRRQSAALNWSCHCRLEASLWGSFAIIGWEVFPILRPEFASTWAPFAEWLALILALVAMITAIQVKRRLQQTLSIEPSGSRAQTSPNPLSLIELLREHGVREFGSMYLYMPMPKQERHEAAWDWIETLKRRGLLKGDAWHIRAEHVKETVRSSHRQLFMEEPSYFHVYRVDWQTLNKIMEDDLS